MHDHTNSMATNNQELRAAILVQLAAAGWTPIKGGTAIANKIYPTAVGPKEAQVYLADFGAEEANYVLQGQYYSEGRNVLAGDSVLIPKAADGEHVRRLTDQFAAAAEATVLFSENASNQAVLSWKKSRYPIPSESASNQSCSEVQMAQATTLQPGQIRHLLRVTNAASRHPERDCLVLLLGLTAGMRVTEIAQIEVQDVLFPSGALRDEISLRAAITKGCRQRCIYLTHSKTIDALDRYLGYRTARGLRTTGEPGRFRGLEPASKLILTHKGYKFHLNTKRRVSWAGEPVEYLACDSLQSHVSKLYRDAGIRGGSSHSGRRTMASRLVAQGNSVETVQLLLGHAELNHVRPYLAVSQQKMCDMFASVL